MATALHALLALEKGKKHRAEATKTAAYHAIQRPDLFAGLAQTYTPFDLEGEQIASEESWPQLRGDTVLTDFQLATAELINLTATKDEANTEARADVLIGGTPVLRNVPVTTLLYLEKQLGDLRTVLAKLPVPDPAKRWSYDPEADLYRAPEEHRNRTQKVPRVLSKAKATDKHPEQTEVYWADVAVGRYTINRYSSALPAATVKVYLERVDALHAAVKVAREEANKLEQEEVLFGDTIMSYLFAPVT